MRAGLGRQEFMKSVMKVAGSGVHGKPMKVRMSWGQANVLELELARTLANSESDREISPSRVMTSLSRLVVVVVWGSCGGTSL